MAPGLTAIIGGRPKPAPLLRFFSYLSTKSQLPIYIKTSDGHTETYSSPKDKSNTLVEDLDKERTESGIHVTSSSQLKQGNFTYALRELAWLRSGDKGDNCNIGVIARKPEFFPYIKEQLTRIKVKEYFAHKFEAGSGESYR